MALENGGMLPNSTELRNKGYIGLDSCIRIHAEKFKHIKQEKSKRKSSNEHVKTAKELVKKYGILPSSSWLKDNGHNSLYLYIRRYPKLFKGIKQEYGYGKSKTIKVIGE